MSAELCDLLTQAGLCLGSLFLNADKAFDTNELRCARADCGIAANIARNQRTADWQTDDNTPLDPELYRRRLVIEQMNTLLNGFKALLTRYETYLENWLAWHWLAFATLLLRKIAHQTIS